MMKRKSQVYWYPWVIALLFAAIFVWVTAKYVSQLRKEPSGIVKTHFYEDEEEY